MVLGIHDNWMRSRLVLLKLFDSRWVLVGAAVLSIAMLTVALFGPANVSKLHSLRWILCFRNVVDHFFPCAQFAGPTPWFIFRNIVYGNCRRCDCSIHNRVVGRHDWIALRNDFLISDPWLHFEYRFLGTSFDYKCNHPKKISTGSCKSMKKIDHCSRSWRDKSSDW